MPHGLPDFWQGTIAGMPAIGAGQVAWYQSDAELVDGEGHKDLLNYVAPDTFELHICSGVVSCDFPRFQRYDLRQTPAGSWVSPIAHYEPTGEWLDPEKAYDGDVATFTRNPIDAGEWSPFLELLINEVNINKIRFYSYYTGDFQFPIDVDVWYAGDWHHVYEGAFANEQWVEKDIIAGTSLISKARVRFQSIYDVRRTAIMYEFQFNTHEVTPQEGIWFDTHSIIPYLPQAPYIVEPRATFAVRVYNDDEVAHNMSVALAGFLQKKTM